MAYYVTQRYIVPEPPTLDPVLNNNSWSAIQWAVKNNAVPNTWNVGDRKAVVLNGTVGAKTFSNQTVYAYIIGFNHNASVEGNNTIHFQFGFDALTGGNHIAFCDLYYGSNAGSVTAFKMNSSNEPIGGWKDSYMRNTIIPAFINAMPSDLQAVLKTVNKYTDNGTGETHQSSSDITATSDKVFLLAEYEIYGVNQRANQYEQNSQAQYAYYSDDNSKVMYNDTSTSSVVEWWERSPYYAGYQVCTVDNNGNRNAKMCNRSYGFAPAFVVG